MNVTVGKTQLEEHEVEEIRLAIGDRKDVLTKARKAAENAHLYAGMREADAALEVCERLNNLFDPVGHAAEEMRRNQGDLFVARPGESIEEAMEGVERAASRQRQAEASQEPEEAARAAAGDVLSLESFRQATRPHAEPGEATTILMQGLHTLLFERDGAELAWRAMHEAGGSDDEIETMIRGAFIQRGKGTPRFGFSEPVGMNGNEPVDFATIDCTHEPLSIATGKGKKKQKLEGELLVGAVRAMLAIPDAPEPHDQPAVEFAGAAADDLFGDD